MGRERLGESMCSPWPDDAVNYSYWRYILSKYAILAKLSSHRCDSAETDEAMESGGGLASLGRHSDAGTPKDPAWKHALRSLILYIASLLCLLVLDAIWMKGIAPALGVDYFAVVKVSPILCSYVDANSYVDVFAPERP